jgi:hypothetical protein
MRFICKATHNHFIKEEYTGIELSDGIATIVFIIESFDRLGSNKERYGMIYESFKRIIRDQKLNELFKV